MSIPCRAERQSVLFVVLSKPFCLGQGTDEVQDHSRCLWRWGGVCQRVCTASPLEGHLVGNGSASLLHKKGSVSKMSLVRLLLSLKS